MKVGGSAVESNRTRLRGGLLSSSVPRGMMSGEVPVSGVTVNADEKAKLTLSFK